MPVFMPWQSRCVVNLRKDFVLTVLGEDMTVVEACEHFGISRKTGYKWLQRYDDRGVAGLVDRHRKPKTSPRATSGAMTTKVIELRKAHPTWGAKKLHRLLDQEDSAPSRKTIERILERAGLARRYRKRRTGVVVTSTSTPIVREPNDLWTVDFKGWWLTQDYMRCEPLTVRDAFSRYVLVARAVGSIRRSNVKPVFEELFKQYGLPRAIQSDNGSPFASVRSLGGISRLSAWWVSLGIDLVRSRPGCPQDNGGHERMHADLYRDVERKPAANMAAQNIVMRNWAHEFNHVRPHEALAMRTPAAVYKPSARHLSDGCCEYSERMIPTRVGCVGKLKYGPWTIYAAQNLAGYELGLEPADGHMLVWFGSMLLGHFVPGEDDTIHAGRPGEAPSTRGRKVRVSPAVVSPPPLASPGTAARTSSHAETDDFNFLW